MQRDIDDVAQRGRLAVVPALAEMGVLASVEYGRPVGRRFELLLWLTPPQCGRIVRAGEFWAEWHFGEPCWVRFRLDAVVFNRAAFAAVEVRPARDPAQRPQGALWLPSEPLTPLSRATS